LVAFQNQMLRSVKKDEKIIIAIMVCSVIPICIIFSRLCSLEEKIEN